RAPRRASYLLAAVSNRWARTVETPATASAITTAAAAATRASQATPRRIGRTGAVSDHSSASTARTASRSSGGGSIWWAAREKVLTPSASAAISCRHPAQPRRCRLTCSSADRSSVPSRYSASWSRTSSQFTLLLQGLAKLEQGRPDPGLGRPQRDALELGDLRARLAPEVGELERRALTGAERRHRGLGATGQVGRLGELLGPGLGRGLPHLPGGVERPRLEHAPAQAVDRQAPGHQQHPRVELAAGRVEPVGAPPELDEGVLDQVLGSCVVAEHHDPQPVDP